MNHGRSCLKSYFWYWRKSGKSLDTFESTYKHGTIIRGNTCPNAIFIFLSIFFVNFNMLWLKRTRYWHKISKHFIWFNISTDFSLLKWLHWYNLIPIKIRRKIVVKRNDCLTTFFNFHPLWSYHKSLIFSAEVDTFINLSSFSSRGKLPSYY